MAGVLRCTTRLREEVATLTSLEMFVSSSSSSGSSSSCRGCTGSSSGSSGSSGSSSSSGSGSSGIRLSCTAKRYATVLSGG